MTVKKTVVISVILVIVFAFALAGCGGSGRGGSGGNIKGVINNFFDAIDKHDVEKFIDCLEKEAADELLDYIDEDELEDLLKAWDEALTDEFSKNWRKQVEIGDAEEVDEDDDVVYYEVEVSLDGEDDTIPVVKVKRKYYLDSDYVYEFISVSGSGSGNKSATGVVSTFFEAIDYQDTDLFLSCFEEERVAELLSYYDTDSLKEQLQWMDEMLTFEYGDNWIRKVKIGQVRETDKDGDITCYEVDVSFDGEEGAVLVYKVKGRYYLDDVSL